HAPHQGVGPVKIVDSKNCPDGECPKGNRQGSGAPELFHAWYLYLLVVSLYKSYPLYRGLVTYLRRICLVAGWSLRDIWSSSAFSPSRRVIRVMRCAVTRLVAKLKTTSKNTILKSPRSATRTDSDPVTRIPAPRMVNTKPTVCGLVTKWMRAIGSRKRATPIDADSTNKAPAKMRTREAISAKSA